MASTSKGLCLLPKLKLEHIKLTSFSRMRVDLAAQVSLTATSFCAFYHVVFVQVLSQSVANAFAYFSDPDTSETQRFVSYFDTFFDCLNVRSVNEWCIKRKPNLKPYTSPDDPRLKVQNIKHFVYYVIFFINSGLKVTFWTIYNFGKTLPIVGPN